MRRAVVISLAILLISVVAWARDGRVNNPPSPLELNAAGDGYTLPGSLAIPTINSGSSTYTLGSGAATVTIDLSSKTWHMVTLGNVSGTSLVFTGLPTLTNQVRVYQLDLKQPASGVSATVVWAGSTKHTSGLSPTLTGNNGATDTFSLIYGKDGSNLHVYPAGSDLR